MKLRVTFDVIVPEDTPDDEIQEWLEFNLNANGTMEHSSISDTCMEAEPFSVQYHVEQHHGCVSGWSRLA